MEPTSFPLQWPSGWGRTSSVNRRRARFKSHGGGLNIKAACDRLYDELRRLKVDTRTVIISSNVRPTLAGEPRGNAANPIDPGAAVYFRLNGKDRVLACDTWSTLPDNIAAVAGHIYAIRAIDRYGVGTIDQAFEGYRALPAKGGTWRSMLGFEPGSQPSRADVEAQFKARARTSHPDAPGGSHEAMAALNAARDAALEELP